MKRHLLLEMATYDEKDVFAQNAVASVSTEEVKDLEGNDLTICVYKQIKSIEIPKNYHLQPTDIGTIIKHHCGHRDKKKAALLALPAIINAQYVTQAWRKKTSNGKIVRGKDKRPSGMISAPILIDGVKYLCNITQKLALNGDIFPYALALKDENGNLVEAEKMDSTLKVPDSNSKYTTSGHIHFGKVTTSPDTNPSTSAKVNKNDVSVNISVDRGHDHTSATQYNHGADFISETKNNTCVIKESPDSVESTGQYYTHNGSYPFVVFKGFPHEILIGNDGERHDSFEERIRLGNLDISAELHQSILTKKIKLGYNTSYEVCGRCWVNGQGNTISIWSYDTNNYKRVGEKILPIVKALQNNGVEIDIKTLDFDDWEGNLDSIFPFTWLLNGMADIYKKEALQIKEKNGKYIIFCNNGKILICDRDGRIFEQNNKQKNIDRQMSKKNTIRLTESDLKRVISESVKRVLKEYDDNYVDADISNDYNGSYDNRSGYVSGAFENVLAELEGLIGDSEIPYDYGKHRQPTNKYQEIADWANNVLKQGNELFQRYFG